MTRALPVMLSVLPVLFALGTPGAALQASDPSPVKGAGDDEPITRRDVLDLLADAELPVDISGGIYLWHYQPFLSGADPNTSIYWAYLRFDADLAGDVDFHFETMFRDEKLRPFFNSNVWIQEAYLSWKPGGGEYGQLKAGKIYSRFGRFWDGTFYGNIPYFDGLKLDPDLGLSYEHTFPWNDSVSVETSVQYFSQDGGTNGSLQGRDTLSLPGAVERNSFVVRAAPTFTLAEETSLTVGLSGMSFEADLDPGPDDRVNRWCVESALTRGDFTVFAEYAEQSGTHVPDFPVAGANESSISWIMSGVDYRLDDRWLLGYRFSSGDYHDSGVREVFHMPRLQYQLTKAVSVWLEYVHWDQESPSADLDNSLNLVLYAAY